MGSGYFGKLHSQKGVRQIYNTHELKTNAKVFSIKEDSYRNEFNRISDLFGLFQKDLIRQKTAMPDGRKFVLVNHPNGVTKSRKLLQKNVMPLENDLYELAILGIECFRQKSWTMCFISVFRPIYIIFKILYLYWYLRDFSYWSNSIVTFYKVKIAHKNFK